MKKKGKVVEKEQKREGKRRGQRKNKVNIKLVIHEHTMQPHTCICLECLYLS